MLSAHCSYAEWMPRPWQGASFLQGKPHRFAALASLAKEAA